MKEDNLNMYKVISFAFIIIIIVLMVAIKIEDTKNIEVNNLKIPKSTFEELAKATGSNDFVLCEISEDVCVNVHRLKG